MNSQPKCMTWAECHAAGMTAVEAARIRGVMRNCAYSWSTRVGVVWPRPPSAMREPVRIRGIDYPSAADAARELGVPQYNISRHLRLYGHTDNVGLKTKGGQFGKCPPHLMNPVKIGSREWPSRKALAAYIGWPQAKVCRALGKNGTLAMRDRLLAAIMIASSDDQSVSA